MVVYNINKHETAGVALTQTRDDEEGDLVMPSNWSTGDSLSCYLAFRRADGTVVDVSTYSAGSIVA
jgi:6-phosphogluconolactonase (cycloisomerase 2 family)